MELRILGPLEAHDDGQELALPKGRARALLALLLLHRGEVVSTDRILYALWGEQPPPTAGKAVQGYVSALRRSFHSCGAGDGRLVTRPPGYVLHVAADELDAARFELLASEGRRALEDGEPGQALDALERGLGLWRGPVLAEFAFDEFAQGEIHRFEELRLDAFDDRADALLRLGRGAELVGELDAFVAKHPLRERSRGLLMLALYRAGRQADALQTYAEGRRLLRLELGLDPSRELQELERGILAQDPALDAPSRVVIERPDEPKPEGRGLLRFGRRRLVAVAALAALVVAAAVAAAALWDSADADAGGATGPPPSHGVVALATDSGEVVARTELGSLPGVVAAAGDAVWVGDLHDGVLTRLDARSGKVVKSIGIGAAAVDVAVGPDAVWVATGSSGSIVRVDPEIGAVVDRIDLAGPDDIVVPDAAGVTVGDDGMLWVASAEGVLRVDPDSKRIRRIDVGPTRVSAVAPVGRAVWANVFDGRTLRLEAGAWTPTAEFSGPGAGPLAADADGVWISSVDSLVSLDPQDASLRGAVPAGGFVIGIAPDGETVWAAVLEKQALLRVNARTLEIEQAIPLGAYPLAVAVEGGRVWVSVVKENPFA